MEGPDVSGELASATGRYRDFSEEYRGIPPPLLQLGPRGRCGGDPFAYDGALATDSLRGRLGALAETPGRRDSGACLGSGRLRDREHPPGSRLGTRANV